MAHSPMDTVQFMHEIAAALPGAARVIHARRQEERGAILRMEIVVIVD